MGIYQQWLQYIMIEIVTQNLKDLVFPKQCFGCKSWGNFICTTCSQTLKSQTYQRCIICQKPSLGGWTHPKCKNAFRPDRLITIFDYQDSTLSGLINTAKLSLVPEIFSELAILSCARLEVQSLLWRQFVLCPIPQTRSKSRWRGFNQSELIAKEFGRRFQMAIDRILMKSHDTKQQKQLNKQQRTLNLRQAFQISQPEYIPRQVLLIDDITTTGSTFLEATKVLKKTGATTIWCVAIAQD